MAAVQPVWTARQDSLAEAAQFGGPRFTDIAFGGEFHAAVGEHAQSHIILARLRLVGMVLAITLVLTAFVHAEHGDGPPSLGDALAGAIAESMPSDVDEASSDVSDDLAAWLSTPLAWLHDRDSDFGAFTLGALIYAAVILAVR